MLLIFLLLVLSMVWPPDSPWSPWWRTSKRIARISCKLVNATSKDTIYELGSGDGTFLAVAAKEFGIKGVGIEVDPLRFLISTSMMYFIEVQDKVKIIRGNFFKEDLSEATIIFVYLVPRVLQRLKPKFLKELKPGTKIVSYIYEIDYLSLATSDKQNKIYVYKI